jgi:hypothetical protein
VVLRDGRVREFSCLKIQLTEKNDAAFHSHAGS